MGRAVRVNIKGLTELKQNLVEQQKQVDTYMRSLASDIAALLLRKVTKRTPVGDKPFGKEVKKTIKIKTSKGNRSYLTKEGAILEQYWSGYVGGNLRRSWTVGEIVKIGNKYNVEVFNPVDYASYVEYGHRQEPGRYTPQIGKKLKKAWVPGKFMLTISENEIRDNLESIIEKRLKVILEKMRDA